MVQFFKGSSDPRDAAYGSLAESLGMGLGNAVQTYRANKALDSVLGNEENANLPFSEKMGVLQRALSPYGPAGEKILMNRLMVEQQAAQEKETQRQAIVKKQEQLDKMAHEKKLANIRYGKTETPDQRLNRELRVQELRNLGKTPAKDRLAEIPIHPEQLAKIKEVRNTPEYQSASPSKKYQLLTENGVSSPLAEAESKIAAEEMKQQPGQEYAKSREKTVESYVTDSLRSATEAENMDESIDTIEKAIHGDITEPGILATLKHDPYGQLFFGLSPDEATLTTANKYMLEGTKGIFGAKPTEREIFTLLNSMLPSMGKTKEANLAGLQVIKRANELKKKRAQIVDELTDGGKNYVPNIESQVLKSMKPFVDKFKKDAYELKEAIDQSSKTQATKAKEGKIKVKAPNGQIGYMTEDQINSARAQNVIFTPI